MLYNFKTIYNTLILFNYVIIQFNSINLTPQITQFSFIK